MKSFFKVLGMGCLYVLFTPFIIVVLAVAFIYNLGLFIGLSFKAVFAFFGGRSIFRDLEEDILANQIIEASKKTNTNTVNDEPSTSSIQQEEVNEETKTEEEEHE